MAGRALSDPRVKRESGFGADRLAGRVVGAAALRPALFSLAGRCHDQQRRRGGGCDGLVSLGSGVSLLAGPWLWLRLRGHGSGQWAIRIAGLALMASSVWALWMGLVHNTAPWCLSP